MKYFLQKNTFFLLFILLTIAFCGKSKTDIYGQCLSTTQYASMYIVFEKGNPYFIDSSGERLSLELLNEVNRVHQSFSEVYFLYIDTYGFDIFKALELEDTKFNSYISDLKYYYDISNEEYLNLLQLNDLTISNYFSNFILYTAILDENEKAIEFCELWDNYDSFAGTFD